MYHASGKDRVTGGWLVLLYQFPKGPDSRRVKIWRRLQNIGAVAIKNSVYVLPLNDQAQEDFQWLLTELRSSGADGVILEARLIDGMSDQQLRDLFITARNSDYQALREEIDAAIESLPADGAAGESLPGGQRALARARNRLAEIEAIDFFGADGHDETAAAVATLAALTDVAADDARQGDGTMATAQLDDLTGRVWVTRRGVRVDRIASAWLIRRWIDPDARFKFVAAKGYEPGDREIRFDMFEAEFTHEGDKCTFEVLAELVRPKDAALRNIAEIVHDIDLKDAKFGRSETDGVANLLGGIVAGNDDDEQRLLRGGQLFEDLYRFYRGQVR